MPDMPDMPKASDTQEGRKIPGEVENPIDNVFLALAEVISPTLHATGHTPNVITLYSAVLGVLAVRALYTYNVKTFAVLHVLSYFFDCVDGHFARKYNMVTKLGDVLDHVKDMSVLLAALVVIFFRYKMPLWGWGVYALLNVLVSIHFGCQQKVYAMKQSQRLETLDVLQVMCPEEKFIRYTRWFGSGTLTFAFVLLVIYVARPKR